MKQPKPTPLYNIVWIVNGVVKETIQVNGSKALAMYKAKQLKETTHKIGLLQLRKINTIPNLKI